MKKLEINNTNTALLNLMIRRYEKCGLKKISIANLKTYRKVMSYGEKMKWKGCKHIPKDTIPCYHSECWAK